MSINLIVAMNRNGLIGLNGVLPWNRRPEDLKNFKEITLGNTVVMGRKTYDSIGKSLPGRNNIIITTNRYYYGKHGKYFLSKCSLQTALYAIPKSDDLKDVLIIGGASIYREFAPYVERMYITVIDDKISPDGEAVYFPWSAFESTKWACTEQRPLGPDFYYIFDRG